jgi:hypothetical protein
MRNSIIFSISCATFSRICCLYDINRKPRAEVDRGAVLDAEDQIVRGVKAIWNRPSLMPALTKPA